jgi:hypothetical protein
MTGPPDPLTPPDCDLRDFAFMPLEVLRLRDSDLAALPDPEAFRAAVIAWCVAWHQVPAASLPNDDGALCRLLGYGRDMKGWQRIREAGGLRGFVLCADGRLYHHVVAEKANESWAKKLAQRERSRKGNASRWGQRDASQEDGRAIQEGLSGDPGGKRPSFRKDKSRIPQGLPADPKGQGEGEREGEDTPLTPAADAAGEPIASKPRNSRAHGTSPRQVAEAARASAPPPPEPDHPLWPRAKRLAVPASDFRIWLAPLIEVEGLDGRKVLIAPTAFHADHVRANFSQALDGFEVRARPPSAAHG